MTQISQKHTRAKFQGLSPQNQKRRENWPCWTNLGRYAWTYLKQWVVDYYYWLSTWYLQRKTRRNKGRKRGNTRVGQVDQEKTSRTLWGMMYAVDAGALSRSTGSSCQLPASFCTTSPFRTNRFFLFFSFPVVAANKYYSYYSVVAAGWRPRTLWLRVWSVLLNNYCCPAVLVHCKVIEPMENVKRERLWGYMRHRWATSPRTWLVVVVWVIGDCHTNWNR